METKSGCWAEGPLTLIEFGHLILFHIVLFYFVPSHSIL